MSTTETPPPGSAEAGPAAQQPGAQQQPPTDWQAVQASAEFQDLRHRLRRFVFPLTGLFLAWYLLFVLLASYAPGFMGHKLAGNINVGLVFGLLQFVSTFAITGWYTRYASRRLDPLATHLRDEIEAGEL